MANEAVLVLETAPAVPYTVTDGASIEKGTALKLTDPRTVAAATADGDVFAGFAKNEKIANDGRTSIAVYEEGHFIVKDSGAGVTVGDTLKVNGTNTFATADEAGAQGAKEFAGQSQETATASQTFHMRLKK